MTEKIHIKQLKNVVGQVSVLPTPTAELSGVVYQYIGATDTYQHGYIYECVEETTTETLIMFDPVDTGKLGFDYTNHNVRELFERIAAIETTFNAEDVASGSFRLDKVNELWYINGYDSDDNTLFTDFTVEATGGEYCLDDYGYIYTFPFPDDYEEGHEEEFRIVRTTYSTYSWERVDVQPGGSRGRFLAIWDCVTGLAESNPPISPYEYKTGDYFVVGTISSATPAVNYKPDGTSYVIGVASTTVETNEVAVDDTYFFDGTSWKLQSNSNKTVTYANIAGDIYDNASATTALNAKASKTTVDSHIANTSNPHSVTKAQVGLSNVDNTSDADKPISTATQNALDLKADKSTTYTKTETDTLLSGKQDTISDLATIRSNATAGKGASDTIATYGDIVTHDVAEFATSAQGTKADTAVQPSVLATVATSGSYTDLSNKPTIPAAQVNSDWSANSGVAQILNKPTLGTAAAANTTDFATAAQGALADTAVQPADLATVATSGSYTDLSDKPTIPTTLAALTGDVDISSPTNGQHLVYDTTDQKWKNQTSAATIFWGGINGTLSNQTDLQNALDAKANTTDLTALLNAIYPVGSVYIGTQSTCPMGAVISGSTWELVSSGRALWTGNGTNANTTIAAGLPNITGGYGLVCNGSDSSTTRWYAYGAMYQETTATRSVGSSGSAATAHGLAFAASRSSSVYGNSSTVQPPAYVVNVWRRTA